MLQVLKKDADLFGACSDADLTLRARIVCYRMTVTDCHAPDTHGGVLQL